MKKLLKVLLIIILVLVGLGVTFRIGVEQYYLWVIRANVIEHKDSPEILKSTNTDAKKALVIYQPSRTDKVKVLAHEIAKGINEQGYEVTINYPGKFLPTDISEYAIIVFGSPVYETHPSSVLLDYMNSINDYSKQKVILFASGYLEDAPELDTMKAALKGEIPFAAVKYQQSAKEQNIKDAYELGKKSASE